MKKKFNSWGRLNFYNNKIIKTINQNKEKNITIYGNGRSYGDVCLNDCGSILISNNKKIIKFDNNSGIIEVESGCTLCEIIEYSIPKGWFLPVTSGTKFVTIGGAIANDIHGKNHHIVGSFGNFIKKINLLRSDRKQLVLTKKKNKKLFKATISGLGLTGYILSAEVQLIKITSNKILQKTIKFQNIEKYFQLEQKYKQSQYSVAWLDCSTSAKKIGRGIFFIGNHVVNKNKKLVFNKKRQLSIPFNLPNLFLNSLVVKIFNNIYWHMHKDGLKNVEIDKFFYPLDSIKSWNNLYGKKGFYQFQCIFPKKNAKKGVEKILENIKNFNQKPLLTILKSHGKETSPGLNTFSMEGTSIALDFQNKGEQTKNFLKKLEEITTNYSGRLYPAKDSIMLAKNYQKYYPNWKFLKNLKDPNLTSLFWKRVCK